MSKILGLDLGSNSIGWAIRDSYINDNNPIEKSGVVIFNTGVGEEKGNEYSYAAKRTKERSVRRLYQARKYRLWATLDVLIHHGYCPMKIEELDRWRKYDKKKGLKREYPVDAVAFDSWIKLDFDGDGKPDYSSPYQLRRELAEQKLDLTQEINKHKLGRALYHIAQRRGFKSSRKDLQNTSESESTNKKESNTEELQDLQKSEQKKNQELSKLYPEFDQAKTTVGVFLANKENEGKRVRSDITQFLIRDNYKNEIKHIFDWQELSTEDALFKELVENGKDKNNGAIFYKRPLRSQKGLVGLCTLEQTTRKDPNTNKTIQTGKYRCPLSHPAFEEYRAWTFLNNIKYKESDNEQFSPLPLEHREKVFEDLFFRKSKVHFPFYEIEKYIKKTTNSNWQFNYKSTTTVSGCPVSARLKDIFGDGYKTIKIPSDSKKGYYDLNDIWHILFSYQDQEYVQEFANNKLNFDKDEVKDKVKKFVIAWNNIPVGYAMLSFHAINKINRFLRKGLIYSEAVLLANLPTIIGEKWDNHEAELTNEISNIIAKNREEKRFLWIVNSLIGKHKILDNNAVFANKDYQLDKSDHEYILETIKNEYGEKAWEKEKEKERIKDIVTACYQAYLTKDIDNGTKCFSRNAKDEDRGKYDDKYHVLETNEHRFYRKADTGFYKMPRLADTLGEFLIDHSLIEEEDLSKIYHPSQIEIYPHAKTDGNGKTFLGSPKTGSFKNPMAMRTLHELKKIMNYLIKEEEIDTETKVIVEVARELNDANKRRAIEKYQKQREEENQEFARLIKEFQNDTHYGGGSEVNNDQDIDKVRLWMEQNKIDEVPPVSDEKAVEEEQSDSVKKKAAKEKKSNRTKKKIVKEEKWDSVKEKEIKEVKEIKKYRLWKDQGHKCIYTGETIKLSDLFSENLIDIEHTIPRSKSFDNSLANLTVCYHDYNRNVKKNKIPSQLGDHKKILARIEPWEKRVEKIEAQIESWKLKSKKANTKEDKDRAIQQRHLWQFELDYWKNKVDRFTMKEITSGFKNSQKVDTQLISKYASHYLKTVFNTVRVEKGAITAEFRKILRLQGKEEKKDRTQHSHHAIDAAVLTLIPSYAKKDQILEKAYKYNEATGKQFHDFEPYEAYSPRHIESIKSNILINNIAKHTSLLPTKKKVRKRGKIQRNDDGKPKIATGDNIRGQLHEETFFGAIKLAKEKDGILMRDENGKFVQEETTRYVSREPFVFKKGSVGSGFNSLQDIERRIVNKSLFEIIKRQTGDNPSKEKLIKSFEEGIYMLDKKGNKVNRIRRIRVFKSATSPLKIKKQTYLSKHDYKHHYYAANGENIAYALYQGNVNGKIKSDYEIITLYDAAQLMKGSASRKLEIEQTKTIKKNIVIPLRAVLKVGQKVIFYEKEMTELKDMTLPELGKRLYKIIKFRKNGVVTFRHHLDSRSSEQLKKLAEQYPQKYRGRIKEGFSEVNFKEPHIMLVLSKGNLNMAVENVDFNMSPDGTIEKWRF